MKSAIPYFMICSIFFSIPAGAWDFLGGGIDGKIDAFVKNTWLDKSLDEAKKKFGASLMANECVQHIQKACTEKFKAACNCYKVQLVRQQRNSQSLYLTLFENKVVDAQLGVAATEEVFSIALEKVEGFAGDAVPSKLLRGKVNGKYESVVTLWRGKDLWASTVAFCPRENVAGKPKINTKLRKCYSYGNTVSRIRDLSKGWPSNEEIKLDY